MTASSAPARRAGGGERVGVRQLDFLPTDMARTADAIEKAGPGVVLEDAVRSLKKVMRQRADGSWHIPNCRNFHVNSRIYGCSEACDGAQDMLRRFKAWRRHLEDAQFIATLDARLGRIHDAIRRRLPADDAAGRPGAGGEVAG